MVTVKGIKAVTSISLTVLFIDLPDEAGCELDSYEGEELTPVKVVAF